MPLQVFVVGAPRSGTSLVTEWIGKVTGTVYMEPFDYQPEDVLAWDLPRNTDWVFKWCHLGSHAEKVYHAYPDALIVDVYREMLNTVFSMAYPKGDSVPPREFEFLTQPGGRDLHALSWWAAHRTMCEALCAIYPLSQVCRLRYVHLSDSRKKLSDFLGRVLPPLEFKTRNIDGLRLHQNQDGVIKIGF